MSELVLVSIIGAVGTILVAFITTRVTMKRNRDDVRLARIKALEERLDKLEKSLDTERRHRRALEDYAEKLRDHIVAGHGPPPPSWPTILQA